MQLHHWVLHFRNRNTVELPVASLEEKHTQDVAQCELSLSFFFNNEVLKVHCVM